MDVKWTRLLAEREADEYDAFVLTSPGGHPLQTRAWQAVARAGGRVATHFALVRRAGQLVGAALALQPIALGLRLPWAWIERGPVVARAEELAAVAYALARSAARLGAVRLRVMPYWADHDAETAEAQLVAAGFRARDAPAGSHVRTLRIDLGTTADADLFDGPAGQQVRWRIRQAERAGARARPGVAHDWLVFRDLHRRMMAAQGRGDRPHAWWDALARHVSDDHRGAFFVCDHASRVVSAVVVLRHGERAFYSHGASLAERVPFSKAVPPLIAAIRWARAVGCTSFDLGGIPTERDPDRKRRAIATFKHDFARTPVRLVRDHATWCVRVRPELR